MRRDGIILAKLKAAQKILTTKAQFAQAVKHRMSILEKQKAGHWRCMSDNAHQMHKNRGRIEEMLDQREGLNRAIEQGKHNGRRMKASYGRAKANLALVGKALDILNDDAKEIEYEIQRGVDGEAESFVSVNDQKAVNELLARATDALQKRRRKDSSRKSHILKPPGYGYTHSIVQIDEEKKNSTDSNEVKKKEWNRVSAAWVANFKSNRAWTSTCAWSDNNATRIRARQNSSTINAWRAIRGLNHNSPHYFDAERKIGELKNVRGRIEYCNNQLAFWVSADKWTKTWPQYGGIEVAHAFSAHHSVVIKIELNEKCCSSIKSKLFGCSLMVGDKTIGDIAYHPDSRGKYSWKWVRLCRLDGDDIYWMWGECDSCDNNQPRK